MSWRQVDCERSCFLSSGIAFVLATESRVAERWRLIGHINNLYNTTFWALVQKGGMEAKDAEKELAVSLVATLNVGIDNW